MQDWLSTRLHPVELRTFRLAQVLEQGGLASYTILFNTTATHGLPAAINQASSTLLRTATGNPGASIAVRNHPLPTLQQEAAVKFSKVAGWPLSFAQLPCHCHH